MTTPDYGQLPNLLPPGEQRDRMEATIRDLAAVLQMYECDQKEGIECLISLIANLHRELHLDNQLALERMIEATSTLLRLQRERSGHQA